MTARSPSLPAGERYPSLSAYGIEYSMVAHRINSAIPLEELDEDTRKSVINVAYALDNAYRDGWNARTRRIVGTSGATQPGDAENELETWSLLEDRWTPKVNDEQWIAGLREYITEKTNRNGVPHGPYMQGMAARFLRMLDASQSTLAESKAKVAQLTEDRDNDCDTVTRDAIAAAIRALSPEPQPGTAQADDARGEE